MISLDKNILDKNSAVARRMVEYGKENELFIIIPDAKKVKFDLSGAVHAETSGGFCKKSQFFKLKKLGDKLIKEKNIEMITTQDPFFTGLVGVWLKKKTGAKLEIQIHGDFFSGDYYRRGSLGNRLRYFIARRIIGRANSWRVVGQRIKMSLKLLGVPEEKIFVRPVPTDEEKIKNYISKINLHDKYSEYKKIFLVLGRLDAVKNIFWLIDVFKEAAPDKLLLIVGGGAEEKSLRNKVARFGLQNKIKFEPWTDDPYSYIKTADCVLFPSLSEGYGLVAMEAAAAGTPIIMNDVGVANYELKPSEKVKILPINDKDKWVKAILEI